MTVPPRPPSPGGDPADEIDAAPIGESLDRVLRSLGRAGSDRAGSDRAGSGSAGPGVARGRSPAGMVVLAGQWEDAVGAEVSARCRPAELTTDGVLVVVVDDPAFITELRFSGATIVEGANRVLGRSAVSRVEVRRRR